MPSCFAPQSKLLFYPTQVKAFVDDHSAPPVNIEISPTHDCPARCPWCWFVSSKANHPRHVKEELKFSVLAQTIDAMARMGVKAITWTGGGDPSVYSAINEAIDLTASFGLEQGMFTNGYKPINHPEKLAWIRLTVTEQFRVPKSASGYAAKTKVGVNFNLCQENATHLRAMVEAARSSGVHYFQVRPALATSAEKQLPVEFPEWLQDYSTENFEVVTTDYKFNDYLKPHGYPLCHGHRLVPFVWHNGDVAVCAYHFGKPEFIFGNLNEQSFEEIWNGERRATMLRDGVAVIPACQRCCKNHEINKALAALRGEYALVKDQKFL